MNSITKTEYNKIKQLLKDTVPYSVYKELHNVYENDGETLLENVFFHYLCYLSPNEFKELKSEIATIINREINYDYTSIPLMNSNHTEKGSSTSSGSLIKPKIEYETLDKNVILNLIDNQIQKDDSPKK